MNASKNITVSRVNSVMYDFIICTYNRENLLLKCLHSIMKLSIIEDTFSVIVINNNSSDSTEINTRRFIDENKLDNYFIYNEHNIGLSFARNRGVKESTGEYIIFVDDDALLREDYLEQLDKYRREINDLKAFGGPIFPKFESIKPDWYNRFTAPNFLSFHYKGKSQRLYANFEYPFGCNMGFHRSLKESFLHFNTSLGRKGSDGMSMEEKLVFDDIKRFHKIYYLPNVIIDHFISDERVSKDNIIKLAKGQGASLSYYFHLQKGGKKISILLNQIAKLVLIVPLSIVYTFLFKFETTKHLIFTRLLIFKKFIIGISRIKSPL